MTFLNCRDCFNYNWVDIASGGSLVVAYDIMKRLRDLPEAFFEKLFLLLIDLVWSKSSIYRIKTRRIIRL